MKKLQQLLLVDRLEQIVHGGVADSLLGVAELGEAAHDNAAYIGLLVLQLADQCKPIHLGHPYIREHHVHRLFGDQLESFPPIGAAAGYPEAALPSDNAG
ncbi:hypothetical protein D3C71_1188960 [compost metagenome]